MMRPSERGAALLAVLAMLILLSTFATLGLDRLRAATAQVADAEGRAQASAIAHAAYEASAPMLTRLKALARQKPGILMQPIRLHIGNGLAILRFSDASSCFNLNSLMPSPNGAPQQTTGEQFEKLLLAAGIPPMEATKLSEATVQTMFLNRILWADPGEWLSVPGTTTAHWKLVGPLFCALPNREATALNINGLTEAQAPLLVAIGLDTDEARRAIAMRPREGWNSSNEFWQAISSTGTPDTSGAQVVGISSRWLYLDIEATVGETIVARRYLLDTITTPAALASSEWRKPDRTHGTPDTKG